MFVVIFVIGKLFDYNGGHVDSKLVVFLCITVLKDTGVAQS